jgi:hypothetical protein
VRWQRCLDCRLVPRWVERLATLPVQRLSTCRHACQRLAATATWAPGDEELEQAALAVGLLARLPGALLPAGAAGANSGGGAAAGSLSSLQRDLWRLWLVLAGHDRDSGSNGTTVRPLFGCSASLVCACHTPALAALCVAQTLTLTLNPCLRSTLPSLQSYIRAAATMDSRGASGAARAQLVSQSSVPACCPCAAALAGAQRNSLPARLLHALQERRRSLLLQLRCGLASCLRDTITPSAAGVTSASNARAAGAGAARADGVARGTFSGIGPGGSELLVCWGHDAQVSACRGLSSVLWCCLGHGASTCLRCVRCC